MLSKLQHCKLLLTILVSPLRDLVDLPVPAVTSHTFCACLRSPIRCGMSSGQRTGSDHPAQLYRYRSGNSVWVVSVAGTVDATDSLPIAVSCTIIGVYHRLQKSLLFERRGISYGNKCYLGKKILH